MKISLITVCYNSEKTIEETIKSVIKQNYKNYEHIFIDGKSKDKTLDIIKKYEKKCKGNIIIKSEKDKSLYDAMNKGIELASGDIIGILNSDDILAHENVFHKIVETFENEHCDACYSDLLFMDETDMKTVKRKWIAKKGKASLGWHMPHPTLYVKKDVYNKIGNFNIKYKIAADLDFMLRLLLSRNLKISYIKDYLIYMRAGGVSTNGLNGYKKSFMESLAVYKDNKIKFAFFINIKRTFKIFWQKVTAKLYTK